MYCSTNIHNIHYKTDLSKQINKALVKIGVDESKFMGETKFMIELIADVTRTLSTSYETNSWRGGSPPLLRNV